MLSQLARCAERLMARLSTAATRFWRRLMRPAHSSLVIGTVADLPRSRVELLAENALLRQQLVILGRRVKTPRLTGRERLSLLFLTRWVPNWRQVLQIIQPDTCCAGIGKVSAFLETEIAPARADTAPAPGT